MDMKYAVTNTVENKVIFESNIEFEFVDFVRKIQYENDDLNMGEFYSAAGASDYIRNYCDNLFIA